MSFAKKNDKLDRRCALEGQGGIKCAPLALGSDDWCHGCKFYICEAHSINPALGHGHDVMDHLDPEEDA